MLYKLYIMGMDHKKDPVWKKSSEPGNVGFLCLKRSSHQWWNVYKDPVPSVSIHVINEISITWSSVPPVTTDWSASSRDILEGRDPIVPIVNLSSRILRATTCVLVLRSCLAMFIRHVCAMGQATYPFWTWWASFITGLLWELEIKYS